MKFDWINNPGIPVPMVRDPKTKKGSVTCTMVVISFGLSAVGVVGKLTRILDGIDISAAHYLLMISLTAYLGRKFQPSLSKAD